MNSLGGYQQGSGGTDAVPSEVGPFSGVWSKPAVWPGDGGYVYFPTNGDSLDAFQRTVTGSGDVSFNFVASTANSGNTFGFGTGTPVVTSNGTTSGSAVLWIIHATGNGLDSQLEAYDPIPANQGSNGTLDEIWSSSFFTSTVFSAPGVDNGVIYVGTKDSTLLGFGLRSTSNPDVAGNNVTFAPTAISQPVTGTATFTASRSTTISSFTLSGSAFAMGSPSSTLPVTLAANQSVSVPITFTPNALGDNPGSLTANATSGAAELTLDGQGVTPTSTFSISPSDVAFEPQLIAGPPTSIGVTFTNTSGSAITDQRIQESDSPLHRVGRSRESVARRGRVAQLHSDVRATWFLRRL